MKRIIIVGSLLLAFLAAPMVAVADCPDTARCWISYGSPTQYEELGTFSTPTCWKFGKGCRPWHCDNNDTNSDHWLNVCISKYKVVPNPSRYKEILWVTFEGGKTGNYSRELK